MDLYTLNALFERALFHKKDFREAEELISQGAEVNGSHDVQVCFFLRAIFNGDLKALRFLLDHGVDINNRYGFIDDELTFEAFKDGLSSLYRELDKLGDQASTETIIDLLGNLSKEAEDFVDKLNIRVHPALQDGVITSSHENKITITDAIKSVVKYDKTLNATDIKLTIDNLQNSKLFEPILAYYALSALQNKHPIYFYNSFSNDAQAMGKSVSGLAHSDGKIEVKKFPISQDVTKSLTDDIFHLLDGKTEFTDSLLENAFTIFFSEDRLNQELKTQEKFGSFLKQGLFGMTEGVLFHEIIHQVMREVFQHKVQDGFEHVYTTSNPYFNHDSKSLDEYRSAICSTLTNIEAKYLGTKDGSCEDLWSFGLDLKTKLLDGTDSEDEEDGISISKIIHGLKFFGKSILGGSTLLSAFSTNTYSSDTLDCEFIPRLPELDFIYGGEEVSALSMQGREHYCAHILPAIITAIQNHPLSDQIFFDTTQDFGCSGLLQLATDRVEL